MVHTVSVSEAALTDSIVKLLLEDVANVSAEANWWHPRVRVVENWLREDANRAGIPDDGTEEMVRHHVQRGDIYPQTQRKCWQHILLELSDLACLEAALHSRDPAATGDDARVSGASPSRGKLRPGKELIILSDEANQEHSGQAAALSSSSSSASSSEKAVATINSARKARPSSSADRRPGAEAASGPTGADGVKAFAGMSMMERQAEWLRKKQDKMEAERLRQEEETERELTFQPKIIRRVTYGEGDKPVKDSAGATAPPRPLKRGESIGNSRKLDATASSGASPAITSGPKEKSIPKPPRPAGQRSKRRKSQTHSQSSGQAGASVSQPIEIQSSLLESMKSELEASKASRNQSSAVEDECDDDNNESDEDEQCATDKGEVSAGATSDADAPIAALNDQTLSMKSWSARPTLGGRRVDFDSGDTKARLVLQDASRFDLTSMYRKTDKKAGRDGVALHMGRREDTFEEEVIAVLFDKEKVSELEAARWWLDHEHRFAEFMRESVPSDSQ